MERLSLKTRVPASGSEAVVLEAEGTLDINTVGDFETCLRNLVKNKKNKIVLSMKNLSYISSAGIGVLMCFVAQIRKNHGDLKLANVNPGIYRIFEILDLSGTFQILNTEQDAINAFREMAYGNNT